jgi:hypothetical protein
VLVGHGSFDGQTAKFNLRGPDVSAQELAEWLKPLEMQIVLVNCSSASGPWINATAAPGRVVITATKSGDELNFARFGGCLAEAIGDSRADLDKDDQVSLLESYLTACRGVAEFYENDRRLATEHALLDDNGDALGTPASMYVGLRSEARAKQDAPVDGARARQIHLVPSDREAALPREVRARRDELEQSIAALQEQKDQLGEDVYYQKLELLALELAQVYRTESPPPENKRPSR